MEDDIPSARHQPPSTTLLGTLFVAMLREEWRLHATLFGRRRFAAFPIFITVLTAGGVALLQYGGIALSTTIAGIHALAFLFGLQTGTVGFVGRDAMRDLLGEVTLVAFSSRTLPIGRRATMGVFLLKDLTYYAGLFLTPLTIAFVPSVLAGDLTAATSAILWVTLLWTFALGIAVTMTLVSVTTRGRVGRYVLVGSAVAIGLAWVAPVDLVAVTPYALFRAPSLVTAALALAPTPLLGAIGVWLYDPTDVESDRTARSLFTPWHRRLAPLLGDEEGIATRSLLEVHRSSGGFGKLLFSGGVLFVVSAFLVELVAPLIGSEPSTGVTFGALLGLTAFTTYNWLTQFDDVETYRGLPVPMTAVFEAKFRAFVAVAIPIGVALLGIAVAWLGGRPAEIAVGAVLLIGLQVYLFGLVSFLSGFSPNEFLFDTVLFIGFAIAVAVPLVPALVVGLVMAPVSIALLGGLTVEAMAVSSVGLWLKSRAAPRWRRIARADSG